MGVENPGVLDIPETSKAEATQDQIDNSTSEYIPDMEIKDDKQLTEEEFMTMVDAASEGAKSNDMDTVDPNMNNYTFGGEEPPLNNDSLSPYDLERVDLPNSTLEESMYSLLRKQYDSNGENDDNFSELEKEMFTKLHYELEKDSGVDMNGYNNTADYMVTVDDLESELVKKINISDNAGYDINLKALDLLSKENVVGMIDKHSEAQVLIIYHYSRNRDNSYIAYLALTRKFGIDDEDLR